MTLSKVSDVQSLTEKLREKIRNSVGDLIPEEQWNALIEAEIKSYFEQPQDTAVNVKRSYGYNSVTEKELKFSLTPFRALVYFELNHIATSKMSDAIHKIQTETEGPDHDKMQQFIKELIQKNFSAILEAGFKGMLTEGIFNMLRHSQHVRIELSEVENNDASHPFSRQNPQSPNYDPSWFPGKVY